MKNYGLMSGKYFIILASFPVRDELSESACLCTLICACVPTNDFLISNLMFMKFPYFFRSQVFKKDKMGVAYSTHTWEK